MLNDLMASKILLKLSLEDCACMGNQMLCTSELSKFSQTEIFWISLHVFFTYFAQIAKEDPFRSKDVFWSPIVIVMRNLSFATRVSQKPAAMESRSINDEHKSSDEMVLLKSNEEVMPTW